MIIGVQAEDLAHLIEENARLLKRVDELLESNTDLVNEKRALDIDGNVRCFMRVCTPAAYAACPSVPTILTDEPTIRHRARLVAEEFIELLDATFDSRNDLAQVARDLNSLIDFAPIAIDLPELADACGDLDYVVAGVRIAFGVDGRPVAKLIHETNMKKADGPIRPSDGKRMKPPGWKPPDIAGELVRQGFGHPAFAPTTPAPAHRHAIYPTPAKEGA